MSEKGEVVQAVRDRLKYQEENKEKVEKERQQRRIEMMLNSPTNYNCKIDETNQ
ncbi:hypothetical protein KAR91_78985 [Candidatus Pacearchaeota archaeon]|nr:hypothetical protein [Candidatus Pacearchaeota archaeon]